jgi:hypothetical protein
MLAEAYPWWLFLVFLAAFAVGWRLIGWLYDRITASKRKSEALNPKPGEQGQRKIDDKTS